MYFCRICLEWHHGDPDHHHQKKFAIFGEGDVIEICRFPAHDALEELIRKKENAILAQHPEIYSSAIEEMVGNHVLIDEMINAIVERRKNRQLRRKGWRYK